MLREFESDERVVHCQREDYDIYIGRPSFWENPYTHIKSRKTLAKYVVKNRQEALQKYREYVLTSPEMIKKLTELKGKKLGCWCYPQPCHGEVLIQLMRELSDKKTPVDDSL